MFGHMSGYLEDRQWSSQVVTPSTSPSLQTQMGTLRMMKLVKDMPGRVRHLQEQSTESLVSRAGGDTIS